MKTKQKIYFTSRPEDMPTPDNFKILIQWKNLMNKSISEIARAEYIEVEPNVRLQYYRCGRRQTYRVNPRLALK